MLTLCHRIYAPVDGKFICTGNSSNQTVVAILINNGLNIAIMKIYEIVIGRMLAIQVNIENKQIIIVNIYGPNKDDMMFFQKLEDFIKSHPDSTFP